MEVLVGCAEDNLTVYPGTRGWIYIKLARAVVQRGWGVFMAEVIYLVLTVDGVCETGILIGGVIIHAFLLKALSLIGTIYICSEVV